ncbi:MAG: CoA transferase [Clostridiales bacterium]|nr:CoA transferase [Clostridiales bacterium]
MTEGALEGVRIIDITQFQSGTVCTMTLAWLGAEVIKVERPKTGELNRYSNLEPGIDSYSFITCNANKKSVTLNVKTPEGKEILWKLLECADVFIENMAPGAIDRLGFDYDTVHERCPQIIYAQIKGFGLDGPWADFPAFDPIAQATGGSTSINGYPDGPPLQPGVDLADSGAGYMMALAITAALYRRKKTGVGQRIEVAMQDTVIAFIRGVWEQQLRNGKPASRVGNDMPLENVAPANMYPCKPGGKDDYVHIYTARSPGSKQFELLMKKIGRPDILEDPRFATPQSRYLYKDELDEIISAWTRQRTKIEAMEELCKEGIPAGANLNTEDITNDPYLRKRGIITEIHHPQRGSVFMPYHPMKMEGTVPAKSAPLLGEHNTEIYHDLLGLPEDYLDALTQKGVI